MAAFDTDDHTLPPRTDAIEDLLPVLPYLTHPPGAHIMLRLIAYDISDARRWRRICETCEDYGVRVQLSLFECWLDDDAFASLWERLQGMLDANEDRLVAYTLDGAAVRKRRTAGQSMRCTEKVVCYIA